MPLPRPHAERAQAELSDLAATRRLAKTLARCLQPGMKIYLSGDLGTGKTTLIRELLRQLGHAGRVNSPSFTLMEPYNLSKFEVHHFDFYRLSDPGAWRDAGFEDSFAGAAVVLVEWPEHAGGGLPTPDLRLTLRFVPSPPDGNAHQGRPTQAAQGPSQQNAEGDTFSDGLHRHLEIEAIDARGLSCLNALLDEGCCAREPSQA